MNRLTLREMTRTRVLGRFGPLHSKLCYCEHSRVAWLTGVLNTGMVVTALLGDKNASRLFFRDI